MKQLKTKLRVPPGGWRYVDPDTGFEYDRPYRSFADLVDHVRRYRSFNGLPRLHQLRFLVEDWLCSQPDMDSYCREFRPPRSLEQFISGARAAVKVILKGDESYTSQDIAEARAEICVKCRHNKFSKVQSRLEYYTNKYIKAVVGDRNTSLDEKLFTCEVCTCPLRPKVHISQAIIEESLTKRERRLLAMGVLDVEGNKMECWQVHPIDSIKENPDADD